MVAPDMHLEKAKRLGIDINGIAENGETVRVADDVLAALTQMLTLPESAHAGITESFTVLPETRTLINLPPAAQDCLSGRLKDENATLLSRVLTLHPETAQAEIAPLPMGYYTLELDTPARTVRCLLLVAPAKTYQPESLFRGKKMCGMSVQLYSLRSRHNWGIGDLGDIRRLAKDFAADGIDFIGINPLHALFMTHPEWASPYSPSSRRWLNVIYLDVADLQEFRCSKTAQKWFHRKEMQKKLQALRQSEQVDYPQVLQLKLRALHLAYQDFDDVSAEQSADRHRDFEEFIRINGKALQLHAAFEALEQYFHDKNLTLPLNENTVGWLGWPKAYRHPDNEAVREFMRDYAGEIRFYMWLQWLMADRLSKLRHHCLSLGLALSLYGDLAVGVSKGGSDTWIHREDFCLQASVGAPPDELGPAGQNWGLPPLLPQRLKQNGYQIFTALLRANMRYYGILRIDHVMALYRLWWVVSGKDARNGAYVHYPIQDLMAVLAIESHRQHCVVVGEDLGIVPDELRRWLSDYGVYSYCVMYFSRDNYRYLPPQAYTEQALAVVSTHDLAPLAGFWQQTDIQTMNRLGVFGSSEKYQAVSAMRETCKTQILEALKEAGLLPESSRCDTVDEPLSLAIHRFVAGSRSKLFALQPENLLPVTVSFNIPGIADGYPNWRYRLPVSIEDMQKNKQLHETVRQISASRQQVSPPAFEYSLFLNSETTLIGGVEMTSEDNYMIDQLFTGVCSDPFSYLGPHDSERGIVIRALFPDADTVKVLSSNGKSVLAEMTRVDDRGFFVASLPKADRHLCYQFEVRYGETRLLFDDVYRFPSCLYELDNWLLSEGTHLRPYEQLGAHLSENQGIAGVNFSVWAPNARRVSVVGDFNCWDGRRHVMRFHPQSGIWEIFIPGIAEGSLYKFEILDANGQLRLKSDPYAFASQMRPETASIVTRLPERVPYNPQRLQANAPDAPISIYEVHLGSWRRNPENNFWLSYDELGDALIDYVKDMGFTHIELLPLSEFPFDGSWGYQPLGLYAPTSRFGSPQGLCRFIEKAHAAGIYVLLDWVVGHFPTDEHGLRLFDGTPLYEHADPKEGYHQDWNTLIYNFGRHEVRNYLSGNALYWVERYGIDGLRVDAVASMIYRDYSRAEGEWIPNQYGGRENLEAINFLQRTNAILQYEQRGAVSVAEESTAFPGVSHSTEEGGLGFQFKWNMGWMNDTLQYISKDPAYRKYHHNLLTFGMVYQYSENFVLPISHDEVVHGKGSMLSKMPGDCWQKFANLRTYYGYMWGYPGKKLLFMGCEFAQGREWNYQESLDWFLLEPAYGGWHEGVQRWVRDLNRVYQAYPALWHQDYRPEGFEWLVVDDAEQSVVAFARHDRQGNTVIVVCNFTPVPRHNYRIGVNQHGTYREILNSDDPSYNGSGVNNGGSVSSEVIGSHGKPYSVNLTVPPLGTLFLVLEKE